MRGILFRGKRVDNGEWIYGWYIKANIHWHKYGVHKDWIVCNAIQNGGICNVIGRYAVVPETVGQFIGLTDKNGNRIFEGDICRVVYLDRRCDSNGKHYEVENVMIEEVVFEKGAFCFKITIEGIPFYRPIGFDIYEKQKIKYFEVIGNVYDNPELLEVDE